MAICAPAQGNNKPMGTWSHMTAATAMVTMQVAIAPICWCDAKCRIRAASNSLSRDFDPRRFEMLANARPAPYGCTGTEPASFTCKKLIPDLAFSPHGNTAVERQTSITLITWCRP